MDNEIKLVGTDFLIDLNEFKYNLKEQCYSSEVKMYLQLPVSEIKNIGNFLGKVVDDKREEDELLDKNFLFVINDIDNKFPNLELEGSDLTLSIGEFLLDDEFNLEFQIWASILTNKKLKEISEIQDNTWIFMDSSKSGEEINKIWERRWGIRIKEIKMK